jgi:hypothetical protein
MDTPRLELDERRHKGVRSGGGEARPAKTAPDYGELMTKD